MAMKRPLFPSDEPMTTNIAVAKLSLTGEGVKNTK